VSGARRIAPISPSRPWQRPRCEAKVTDLTARWREYSGKDDICEMRAHYEIGGAKLCKRHAGQLALTILLDEERK